MMKVGICTGLDNLKVAREMGFDYIELPLNSVVPLDKKEFDALRRQVDSAGSVVEVVNGFFPWEFKFAGERFNEFEIREYIKEALPRAAGLGAKIIVVGNGGARNAPAGWPMGKAIEQLVRVL